MNDKLLVFQTDFGRIEGTVSQMTGVALKVDPSLRIFEITHDIPRFNIWEASYRLFQSLASWPDDTVFVSVVDPGVGSDRKSVVVKTAGNRLIVTPDNGSLTHIHRKFGISEVRIIDESVHRAPGSEHSHTFHGRDVYGYTGALLASGRIGFDDVGDPMIPDDLILLPVEEPDERDGVLRGIIEILDVHFGNVWTNIPLSFLKEKGFLPGDRLKVKISRGDRMVYDDTVLYGRSFASVEPGEEVFYINELLYGALSVNQDSFAERYRIGSGSDWCISLSK